MCIHGKWTFGGTDYERKRTKWRCPTGECSPKTNWLRASLKHPPFPRGTKKWKHLYRHGRMASEGVFSTLKEEHALDDLRSRGIVRARRHVDLSIIAMLAKRLVTERPALARAGPPGE